MAAHAGIPTDAVSFYADLTANNDREWWAANRDRWQTSVRQPVTALTDALAEEFGSAKLFRPNRDVRFSKDKSPYKTHQGAVVGTSAGCGLYVQVSARGLMTGAGWYQPTPAQLRAYRAAVLAEGSGAELDALTTALAGDPDAPETDDLPQDAIRIDGDQLKTAPRGFPKDHPRVHLLRFTSMLVSRDHGTPTWLASDAVVDHVREDWRIYAPLLGWFAAHLAP
ncbi:DUF2461 domain-containing protein [Serinibacter salmoneus]|uniref:Uncharacterized protein (TIGR02453 family) n=1 Tax=Serinibacter salmoneus TaxID=556530 RepID=A0A2A9D4D7_9MICO|nr:DUF2461 domain-containing protein [Serinibacter salmoneus]PFG21251.1 uncharacterized protein (TIGR02453 family) [Serinibacter salmoneus]